MTSAIQEPEFGARAAHRAEGHGVEPPREDSVGEILARARAARGFTLEDVAQQLKFGSRQLAALEQDRFDQLPSGTFARGMVRSYARLLKLDADALLARMQGKFDTPDSSQLAARFKQPVPFSDASRRSNVIYAVLSVLILVAVAGVLIEWQQERTKATRLAFIPAARMPLEPPRTVAAQPAQDKAIPAAPAVSAAAAPPAVAPVTTAAAAAAPVVEKPAPAAGAETRRIVLQFDEESWVEVRDATGHRLVAQLMPGGSKRVIEGKPPFALVIGNAQYVHLVYDDKPFDLKPYIRVEVARFTLK
jgi:cytoskeleton protein RodZ